MHIVQISLVRWLDVVYCVPPCLSMYANAVELSDMILKCLTRFLRGKNDFVASFIARSSKQFICLFRIRPSKSSIFVLIICYPP